MPQYPNARVSFGAILLAIENQLVADAVVADRAQITWGLPDNIPQLSGPTDVLLVPRNGQHEARDGGPAQFQVLRYVDVWYRSEAIPDPGGGFKTWITEVFAAADRVINSVGLDGFWPEDADRNLLTVQAIQLVGDVPPDYVKPGSVYGTYVATLSVLYMPAIDPTRGVFP